MLQLYIWNRNKRLYFIVILQLLGDLEVNPAPQLFTNSDRKYFTGIFKKRGVNIINLIIELDKFSIASVKNMQNQAR